MPKPPNPLRERAVGGDDGLAGALFEARDLAADGLLRNLEGKLAHLEARTGARPVRADLRDDLVPSLGEGPEQRGLVAGRGVPRLVVDDELRRENRSRISASRSQISRWTAGPANCVFTSTLPRNVGASLVGSSTTSSTRVPLAVDEDERQLLAGEMGEERNASRVRHLEAERLRAGPQPAPS